MFTNTWRWASQVAQEAGQVLCLPFHSNQKSKPEVILASERNSEMSDSLKNLLRLSPLCPYWIPWSLAISSAVNWTLEWNSTHLCSHCSVGVSLLHHPYLSMLAVLASLGPQLLRMNSRYVLDPWPGDFLQLVICDSWKISPFQSLLDHHPLLPD